MKIEFLEQIFFKNLGENQTVLFYSKFPEILGTLGKSLKNKTSIKKKWCFIPCFTKILRNLLKNLKNKPKN